MSQSVGPADVAARVFQMARALVSLAAKAVVGVFLFVAALAALVATTLIAFMLAIAAVFLTFAQGFGRSRREVGLASDRTLEARRTADGWVTEV